MQETRQLLSKALDLKSASAWARELEITPAAFTNAKARGRLSPSLAGNLAMKLGENPEHWIAVAALEAEPESTLLQRLKNSQANWRKR